MCSSKLLGVIKVFCIVIVAGVCDCVCLSNALNSRCYMQQCTEHHLYLNSACLKNKRKTRQIKKIVMRRLVNLFQSQVTVSEICVIGRKVCKEMEDRSCEVVNACNGTRNSPVYLISPVACQHRCSTHFKYEKTFQQHLLCHRIANVWVTQTLKVALFVTSHLSLLPAAHRNTL